MTGATMAREVDYPQSPKAWRLWIEDNLGLTVKQGRELVEQGQFPFDQIEELWKRMFSEEHGYSAAFIPALTRNKDGLVQWVYMDKPEPNWTKSDNANE
jgi:hypothetical protein